jgi:predicted RNase H-like nuclease (RuvC/YqgF family)
VTALIVLLPARARKLIWLIRTAALQASEQTKTSVNGHTTATELRSHGFAVEDSVDISSTDTHGTARQLEALAVEVHELRQQLLERERVLEEVNARSLQLSQLNALLQAQKSDLHAELEALQREAMERLQRTRGTLKLPNAERRAVASNQTPLDEDFTKVVTSTCILQPSSVACKALALREVPTRRHSCHAELEILRGQRILSALEENAVQFYYSISLGLIDHR